MQIFTKREFMQARQTDLIILALQAHKSTTTINKIDDI